jgi:hypothetical protein
MNAEKKKNGLSARRKTIDTIRKISSSIKSHGGLVIAIALLLSSCHKPSNGQDSEELKNKPYAEAHDSLRKPKVNIKVNRRYDEKGKMIGFDSTYSMFYSNVAGDTTGMDSLMNSFDSYFNLNHSSFFKNEFNPLFFNDSLRYRDFFHQDFFRKRYELNDEYFKDMMFRMDSIKNQFYREHSKKFRESKDL